MKFFSSTYLSSSICFLLSLVNKVLVATGYPTSSSMGKTEVLDLLNEGAVCQDFAPFAKGIYGGTGAMIDQKVLICGGYDGSDWTVLNLHSKYYVFSS